MPHLRPRVSLSTDTVGTPDLTLGAPDGGAALSTSSQSQEDSYLAKVITYIPAEVIAAYQAVVGFTSPDSKTLVWFAVFLIIATPLWLLFATSGPGERLAWYQAAVGFIAFLVWLFVIKSPFWDWFWQLLGGSNSTAAIDGSVRSTVLICTTLLFPLVERILRHYKVQI
jgi:hypothetical protein